jgi:hypothetical protein
MELPEVRNVTETAKDKVRSALPWLPEFKCPECGELCEASRAHDPQTGAFYEGNNAERPSWYCDECDTHYRRDETGGMYSADPWDR